MSSTIDAVNGIEGTFRYSCPSDFVPQLAIPFDEALPNLLIPHLLVFQSPPNQRKQELSQTLQEGVRATADEIPILAVNALSSENDQENANRARYHLIPATLQLSIQDASADFAYEEMKQSNFCDDFLPGDVFDATPTTEDPKQGTPMCRIKATFVEGGLVLCLAYNHLFGDARSYDLATRALARSCCAAALSETSSSTLSPGAQKRELLAAEIPQISTVPKTCPSLAAPLAPADGAYTPAPPPDKAVTQLIRINTSSLPKLKAAAGPHDSESSTKWISTHDAVCALLFGAFSRARHACDIISDNDSLLFSVAIDIRPYLRDLPSDWLGNAIAALRISVPAREAIGTESLRHIAAATRSSIASINEDRVQDFFAQARATPGYMLLDNEVGRASADRGAMLTPWRNFALASMEWPEQLGHYQVMRFPKAWQPVGWFVIFPELQDGTWEVTTHIEERLWRHMAQDDQIAEFASVAWSH